MNISRRISYYDDLSFLCWFSDNFISTIESYPKEKVDGSYVYIDTQSIYDSWIAREIDYRKYNTYLVYYSDKNFTPMQDCKIVQIKEASEHRAKIAFRLDHKLDIVNHIVRIN